MNRYQVSKLKYIELVNEKMKEQELYKPSMKIKSVPSCVNHFGFAEVSGLPDAKSVLVFALIEVDKKYWYEIENDNITKRSEKNS